MRVKVFNHDITYCAAGDCSNKECERHLERLEGYGKNYVSIANFSGICRYYIAEVLRKIEEEQR